jgi:hypothetical protein
MTPAWFCVPIGAATEQAILGTIADALNNFDLPPPTLIALSQAPAAARDGAHVFALGSARQEGRLLGRGFFMDCFADAFPVTFVGREEYDGTEVFEAHGPQTIYLTSRPGWLGGQVDKVGAAASDRSAVAAGVAWSRLRASAATLDAARLFVWRDGQLWPVAPGPFVNLIEPGINADSDLWPIASAAPATQAPRAPGMTLDQSMELLNDVGATLRQGGDLQQAKLTVERVLASFPRSDRALALRGMVLQKLGDHGGLEQALRAAFDEGVVSAPIQRGMARASTVGVAAQRLAEHLAGDGRAADAREVIERACQLLHPDHAQALRARARID